MRPATVFFVTTSPCREWVICAPAAFLGCGSRFSGSLSGIEPRFPVTRSNHGRRITYHRKLIRQTFERCVAGSRPCDQRKVIQSHQMERDTGSERARRRLSASIGFDLIKAPLLPGPRPESRGLSACISSRITTVIQVGWNYLRNHN